jgi:3-demethoxyubiquinol 3-hydroxylase
MSARAANFVVFGSGPVALASALILAQSQSSKQSSSVRLLLREPVKQQESICTHDTRVYAIAPDFLAWMEQHNIWSGLATRAWPYQRMRVWTDSPDNALEMKAQDLGWREMGAIISHAALCAALLSAVRQEPRMTLEDSFDPVELEQSDDEVVLHGKHQSVRGRWLLAADGAGSPIRQLCSIRRDGHDYGQSALTCVLEHSASAISTCYQRFTDDGPLALLPLSARTSALVYSVSDARAKELLPWHVDHVGMELTALSQSVLGDLRPQSALQRFPLARWHAVRYRDNRVILLGDAAHVVHPLAGQGLNMGLRDVLALPAALNFAGDNFSMRGLRTFERVRRSENALAGTLIHGIGRLFAHQDGVVANMLGPVLKGLNQWSSIKREIVRFAAGGVGRSEF